MDDNPETLKRVKDMIENQVGWLSVNIDNLKRENPLNPPEGSWQKNVSDMKISCMEYEKKFLILLLDTIG